MVFLLVLFLLVVVFLACFIGFNLSYTCTLWLFKTYENVHVAILVLIAFGAGIVFSLLLVLISKFKNSLKPVVVEDSKEKKNKKEKSFKREKTERKLSLMKKGKKSKEETAEQLSQNPLNADN